MVLTKPSLEKLCKNGVIINNVGEVKVESISVMLHLDNQFLTYKSSPKEPFVPPIYLDSSIQEIPNYGHYILPPKGKVIACSQEIIEMPLDLMGFIQTRGSLARGFLMAHVCDGQIEPGYKGKITLEICNLSDFYYKLESGMEFCSLFFYNLDAPLNPEDAYNGRYQNSTGPTPMRVANE
jgi:dCTP deaminase